MTAQGFAVAGFRDGVQWRVEPLPPAVLDDLGVLLAALRSQPPEGGPFVVACVEDEFFVIARLDGKRISLLLSDLTAAVEFPLAEQAMARLGEDPPADDELDEIWPVGDLELFSDLGLPEGEMEDILDDLDALPEEMIDSIVERLHGDLAAEFGRGERGGLAAHRGAVTRSDEELVGLALDAAEAAAADEIPVGAVVVAPDGAVVARAANAREARADPTAHAEVLALRSAGAALGSWQLTGCTLVVTLEPCTMCAGALVQARVARLVFGAWDPKAGAVGSLWDVVRDRRLNHRPDVVGGVRDAECAAVLDRFFARLR